MYTSIFILCGYIVEVVIGKLSFIPQATDLIDKLIIFIKKQTNEIFKTTTKGEFVAALVTLVIIASISYFVSFIIIRISQNIHISLWIIVNIYLVYQLVDIKSLKYNVMDIYYHLSSNNIELARKSLNNLSIENIEQLDEISIKKICVEKALSKTVTDIIAPMFFIMLGGIPLGFAYKAITNVNVIDTKHNNRENSFDNYSYKLNTVINFIPKYTAKILYVLASYINSIEYKSIQKQQLENEDVKNYATLLSSVAFLSAILMAVFALVLHGVNMQ